MNKVSRKEGMNVSGKVGSHGWICPRDSLCGIEDHGKSELWHHYLLTVVLDSFPSFSKP